MVFFKRQDAGFLLARSHENDSFKRADTAAKCVLASPGRGLYHATPPSNYEPRRIRRAEFSTALRRRAARPSDAAN
jgi:hypothetical protein